MPTINAPGYNAGLILHASAERTAAPTIEDIENLTGQGIQVILDVTDVGVAAPELTLTIQGKDPVTGDYFTLLLGAAVNSASTNVYYIFPGATAVANVAADRFLPRVCRVLIAHANTDPISYSIGINVLR